MSTQIVLASEIKRKSIVELVQDLRNLISTPNTIYGLADALQVQRAESTGCEHVCSGNCRRQGCHCRCGEWHDEKGTNAYYDALMDLERDFFNHH